MTLKPVRVLVATPGLEERHVERIRSVSCHVVVVFEPAVPLASLDARLIENAPVEVLLADGLPDPWHPDGALRWVQTASAGVDQDLRSPVWLSPNITVTTAAGVYGLAISQWVLAVILHHAQRFDQVLAFRTDRVWPVAPTLVSTLVAGQTLGIVGYGSIGRACARLGQALGMRVLATHSGGAHTAPSVEAFAPALLGERPPLAEAAIVLPPDGLSRLLQDSDYLVLAAPLTPATRGLIDAQALARMKPSAVLINVARGALIDEPALVDALNSGRLAGAALDVFSREPLPSDSPLFDARNVLLTPHLAGAFQGLWDMVVELFCANLQRYIANRPLLNVVRPQRGY